MNMKKHMPVYTGLTSTGRCGLIPVDECIYMHMQESVQIITGYAYQENMIKGKIVDLKCDLYGGVYETYFCNYDYCSFFVVS